jgi:hypothetical protein
VPPDGVLVIRVGHKVTRVAPNPAANAYVDHETAIDADLEQRVRSNWSRATG